MWANLVTMKQWSTSTPKMLYTGPYGDLLYIMCILLCLSHFNIIDSIQFIERLIYLQSRRALFRLVGDDCGKILVLVCGRPTGRDTAYRLFRRP